MFVVLLVVELAVVVLSWAMGRDLNWDYFNYHAYAAHRALGGGTQDFFAAGYQGYLNPLPFLPLALMQAAGWHSLAIGSVLAAIHGLNALFLYLIARELVSTSARPRSTAAAVTLLGVTSAPYLSQVGTSFADVTTTVPVMAAIWLTVAKSGLRMGMLAVGLAGAAVGLKWTNAPYALAMLVTQVVMLWGPRWRVRVLIWSALVGALSLGFMLLYAVWGWQLWQNYGSPVFPLFNQLFQAPDASIEPIALDRFVPQSLNDLLLLPWRMLFLEGWVYTEPPAPDIRPLLLLGLMALATLAGARRFATRGPHKHGRELASPSPLAIFFIVALAAWLVTSSNGRYAVPLLLLLGPLVYQLARGLLSDDGAVRILVLVIALLQAAHVANAGNPRWAPQPWTPAWLPAEVPDTVRAEPALYVLVGRSSESYLAEYAHPDAVFTNPIGLISIATGGPGWDRFVSLRDRYVGRTKVVMSGGGGPGDARTTEALAVYNDLIDRLGLRLVPERCARARFNVDGHTLGPPHLEGEAHTRHRRLLICDAETKRASDAVLAERRAIAERIMNAYETACPRYFAPHGVQTEGSRRLWTRLYGRFDLYLMIDWDSGDILYRQDRQATPVRIGSRRTWTEDVRRFRCRLPHGGTRGLESLGR
ncbi:MAG: hypothetical protein LC119_06625 [Burkholderiales bacterium]|nr:hypothetical protein [Burkholderiales bacterium]